MESTSDAYIEVDEVAKGTLLSLRCWRVTTTTAMACLGDSFEGYNGRL
ncbi:MAG: hypothetical protein M0019_10520 [Actinomycetota bacterium]|nr:hypothetical protein [Actinomycetota bacterium]